MNQRREKLITPEVRREIRSRKHIYYWRVRRCRALGYKRRPNAGRGVWWARIRLWDGKERQKALGTADDDAPSNGVSIFDFHQALGKAEEWFEANSKDAAPDRREYEYPELFTHIPPPPPYTVGNAAKDYIDWFRVHRRGIYRAYSLVKNQIVTPLGHIPLSDLDPPRIQKWFDGLIGKPPVLATGRLCGPKFAERRTDPESIRKRKNTANTVLAQLKAILNRAFEHGYIDSNWAWVSPTITFHTLRHTYASYAAMAGLPLKAIANQLGHRSAQMVDRFYAHLSEDYLDETIREKMPRLFSE